MKKSISIILSAFAGGLIALALYTQFFSEEKVIERIVVKQESSPSARLVSAGIGDNVPNFVDAAEMSLESVVHVRTKYQAQEYYSGSIMDLLYGKAQYYQPEGTGSGVIISNDGYIVTNNHVIADAQNVRVTLHNQKEYAAKVIGKDPSSDLALLKIEESGLPYLSYGNSDDVKVGEWVLAVGNPFNLNSTVTAGIISAKGRDINILSGDPQNGISPVESFIQTDAAVNPGNSGGALVNTNGELVGINSAIKSNTGSFAGYSFAIPSNIAKKVVADLIEFGSVQRAFLGVRIQNLTSEMAEKENISVVQGVYIAGIADKGSAKEAGLEQGDVITSISGKSVNNVPELQEKLSGFRPGDKVEVEVMRNGTLSKYNLVLKNKYGNTDLVDNKENLLTESLGATFEPVSDKMKSRLGLNYGLQVMELNSGKLMKAGVKKGFIIVRADGKKVSSQEELASSLKGKQGGVLLEGLYPNGRKAYYGIGI